MDAGRKLRRLSVDPAPRLSAELTAGVLAAAQAAESTDAAPPLNDEQLMALQHPGGLPADAEVTHFPMRQAVDRDDATGDLVGYGQLIEQGLSPADRDRPTGTLFVHPDHRRQGLGRALVARMHEATAGNVHLWAPNDSAAAQRLARAAHMVPVRELLVMGRSLEEPLPRAPVPAGLKIRNFVISRDQPGFLEVNARAFADHPEQGRLGAAGLRTKIREPWFDRSGFLLAVDPSVAPSFATGAPAGEYVTGDDDGDDEDGATVVPGLTKDGRIVGFHWTKEHVDEDGGERVGEVYVLGVDPDTEGRGLAKALLVRGLARLREHGCRRAILYVEGDHDKAIGLYEKYGFRTVKRDVLYAQHLVLPAADEPGRAPQV